MFLSRDSIFAGFSNIKVLSKSGAEEITGEFSFLGLEGGRLPIALAGTGDSSGPERRALFSLAHHQILYCLFPQAAMLPAEQQFY